MLNSVCMSVPETYLPATYGFRCAPGAPIKGVIFNLDINLHNASDLLGANFGGLNIYTGTQTCAYIQLTLFIIIIIIIFFFFR